MSNKMLIDATHREETRVVVLQGSKVEEFDFEAANRQQLRGNIYLAKVTRVEPSLQAAFVEYGGNRHGFLAFSEIHPDYYQIPLADRQALLAEQAAEEAENAKAESAAMGDEDEPAPRRRGSRSRQGGTGSSEADSGVAASDDAGSEDQSPEDSGEAAEGDEAMAERAQGDSVSAPAENGDEDHRHSGDVSEVHENENVESVGAEDAMEEVPERRKPRPRQYKIQEVIKRRQVLLVQVVKEERGNKGAALTTYLSLAGRYSVLMPNTARGGGISRKITNAADRKRLKSVASELEVPEGMGVILRTAGANRTRTEIKRDFEYLLRLWENVRELTLRSTAPTLVYEEGSLIKRSIRDLYNRDIDQVLVAGDDAYREAKDFMRMLMPSHAKNVQPYREEIPIFSRQGVEMQLDAMFSPQVTLKSGGYIVINQTEALVAIDVNSGRSTREHSIEDTALSTNMEAAEEIARQLRLRDLAGLIVIDFIDMEEKRNNRSVERKLKDCLRMDRARIQVGHISHFGLMEMSRQRMRTGVLESSSEPCEHCHGTGQVRSISSLSLRILRALEDQLMRNNGHHLYVRTRPDVALYVLNQKRAHLLQLEDRFGLSISISGDEPHNESGFVIERGEPVQERLIRPAPVAMLDVRDIEDIDVEIEDEPEAEIAEESAPVEGAESREGEGRGERRRRRRRRRGGNGENREGEGQAEATSGDETADAADENDTAAEGEAGAAEFAGEEGDSESDQQGRRRRRGRRGGRRRGRGRDENEANAEGDEAADADETVREFAAEEGFAGEPGVSAADMPDVQPEAHPAAVNAAMDAGAQPEIGNPAELENRAEAAPEQPVAAENVQPAVFGESEALEESAPAFNEAEDAAQAEPLSGYAEAPMANSDASADEAPMGAFEPTGAEDPALTPAARGHAVEDDRSVDEGSSSEAMNAPEPYNADAATHAEPAVAEAAPEPEPAPEPEDTGPKRSGWWNRRSFF
ncbi:ribonuclease E [Faunimonas pinastri]|uniref:Ribonuclease E n=1 Tax=Faunimonas pinastri TaxID=1855383 RepID=A0A1H9CZY9_9HYPH|nr:ribonuclease E/G [Faunimonas pinastri]SEQ06088.1 ribonuclease E [Faunimonas pinastri]